MNERISTAFLRLSLTGWTNWTSKFAIERDNFVLLLTRAIWFELQMCPVIVALSEIRHTRVPLSEMCWAKSGIERGCFFKKEIWSQNNFGYTHICLWLRALSGPEVGYIQLLRTTVRRKLSELWKNCEILQLSTLGTVAIYHRLVVARGSFFSYWIWAWGQRLVEWG